MTYLQLKSRSQRMLERPDPRRRIIPRDYSIPRSTLEIPRMVRK